MMRPANLCFLSASPRDPPIRPLPMMVICRMGMRVGDCAAIGPIGSFAPPQALSDVFPSSRSRTVPGIGTAPRRKGPSPDCYVLQSTARPHRQLQKHAPLAQLYRGVRFHARDQLSLANATVYE